jgi:hypothetical protein
MFPGHESKCFYDFRMLDNDEWLVDKITGHNFTGRSIEFNVRWTARDHTWEPSTNVKDLEALDHYFPLMGVSHWQSLACKSNKGQGDIEQRAEPSQAITKPM